MSKYIIKYKDESGKWQTHQKSMMSGPVLFGSRTGAKKAMSKNTFNLIYETNPIKIVKWKR